MFFAYSRDKYEVLVINSLADSITYPKEVIEHFMSGEWTVSVKGLPFHNQALDEAHETIINRRLKQITTRPSHFRTVNLADFMSYLDSVCTGPAFQSEGNLKIQTIACMSLELIYCTD